MIWDIESGNEVERIPVLGTDRGAITDQDFSPVGDHLCVACTDGYIYVYDTKSYAKLFSIGPQIGGRRQGSVFTFWHYYSLVMWWDCRFMGYFKWPRTMSFRGP